MNLHKATEIVEAFEARKPGVTFEQAQEVFILANKRQRDRSLSVEKRYHWRHVARRIWEAAGKGGTPLERPDARRKPTENASIRGEA